MTPPGAPERLLVSAHFRQEGSPMSGRARVALALTLSSLAACGPKEPPPPPPPPTISITASATEVQADGVATVKLSVSHSATVKLIATKGTFQESGTTATSIAGGSGEAALQSCDSRAATSCAGQVRVSASAEDGASGAVNLTFKQVEICNNGADDDGDKSADCADTDCLDQACRLANGVAGVCDASQKCICGTGLEEICTDGKDNNCNGKIDCADLACDNQLCKLPNGADARCLANTCKCPGTAENTDLLCKDGIDDDCDGKVDCLDPDCQAKAPALGKICDQQGHTCTGPDSTGKAACSYCPGQEAAEVTCGDQKDNDCDGLSDCSDSDCNTKTCATNGKVCDFAVASCVCSGNGAPPETSAETSCGDGIDNDCNGTKDCADSSCKGSLASCGSNGLKCTAAGACACSGNGGASQASETTCSDGADNDCDGKSDCEESYCQASGTAAGKVCNSATGHTCSADMGSGSSCSICTVPGGIVETKEGQATGGATFTCNDGKDNDCDGKTDCNDSDCTGLSCDATGKQCPQTGGACGLCPYGQLVETSCDDGVDNDCNGSKDCADSSCKSALASCGPNGMRCTGAGACACTGNGGTTQAAETSCADGADNDCDGRADCQESYCQPSGNQPGKVCSSATGRTCSTDMGSGSSCTVCTVSGGIVETAEGQATGGATLTCGDQKDNDCDGKQDCGDPDCTGRPCDAAGSQCTAGGQCICVSGGAPELNCGDNLDNDCDGAKDCADTDCKSTAGSCGSFGMKCSAAGACVCSGNGGAAQGSETTCNDGFDNDCDGKTNCADSDCQPVGNNLGRICDGSGNTCSVPVSGLSTCSICSGNGGTPQQGAETSCGDGKDNDCDGTGSIDCQDSSCLGLTCSATGMTCNSSLSCTCPGGSVESACEDNFDNDCDGKVDCQDTDCQPLAPNPGASCGPNGRRCNSSAACACSGNGGAAEASEASCGDGFDNDCDGYLDCLDQGCRPTTPPYTNGKDCSNAGATPPRYQTRCDLTGQCICPGGQAQESLCGDNLDNDCDGLYDCLDPDCANLACSATGKNCPASPGACSVCTGNGGTPESSESTCSDGKDNDCNGLIDCADTNCNTKQCNSVSSNYQCQSNVCKDTTSTFTLVVTASSTRLPADGAATATITATLKDGSTPQTNKQIVFSVASGGGSINPTSATTNVSGQAQATFTSSASGGPATVQAAYDTGSQWIYGTVVIEQPKLQRIELLTQQYNIMGVRYSGFQESNNISFKLYDENQQTYPAGLQVTFEHEPKGGSFIGSSPSCTASMCTASDQTDAQGVVTVALHSGTVASVVYVKASATAGGVLASLTVGNIAIVGARASGFNVSLICTPKNVPGLVNHDCSKSLYAGTDDKVSCTAYFADRFTNILGKQTLTTLWSEAGAAGAPSLTNPVSGQSTGSISVTGYPLPAEVDAFTGEYERELDDGCGLRKHSPRDGVVTIIVTANGEEGFVDGSNGKPANGVYDQGENFLDLGEPFIDANDNGVRDGNEVYVDSNGSSGWDGPNGSWDGDTIVWATTRVVYSGRAARGVDLSGMNAFSRWYDTGFPPAPTPQPSFQVGVTGSDAGLPSSVNIPMYFTDVNFNALSFRTTYSLSVAQGDATATFLNTPGTLDGWGMNVTQQYCADQQGSSGCASSCNSSPCYRVVKIDGFSYGRYGLAKITGGTQPSSLIEVRAGASFGGVMPYVSVFGSSQ